VNIAQSIDCFQLDNNRVFYNEVYTAPSDYYLLESDLKEKLRLERKASVSKSDTHGCMVGGLQESWS